MASRPTRRSAAARAFLLVLCAGLSSVPSGVRAQEQAATSFPFAVDGVYNEIETKYIFGFTDGADIGLEGEKALELETNAAWRKRSGRYMALEQEVALEYVPTQNIGLEFAAHGVATRIKDVENMDDRSRVRASGLSAKFSYLLVGRGPESPVGLTFSVEPEWSRVEGDTGAATRALGATFKLIADAELIANRLYAAVNFSYSPETAKAVTDPAWQRSSAMGLSGALAWRFTPIVTAGVEGQFFNAYDSLGFGAFQGRAVYVGPTLHVQVTRKIIVAAAYSAQIAGHALADDRRLDLTNFSRHRARLKFEYEF